MTTTLYYFTGTGNSLLVAQKLAAQLENVTLKPLNPSLTDVEAPLSETIGFVYPVYFTAMPDLVKRAIEQIDLSRAKYLFAVTTSGGMPGNALADLDTLLQAQNKKLSYGYNINMPDNSIMLRTPDSEAEQYLAQVDEKTANIALEIKKGLSVDKPYKPTIKASLTTAVTKLAVKHIYHAERTKADMSRCNGCQSCIKLCPVGNIRMEADQIVFDGHCDMCFACINWCPKQAIQFGRIDTTKKPQYRCPSVTMKDVIESR